MFGPRFAVEFGEFLKQHLSIPDSQCRECVDWMQKETSIIQTLEFIVESSVNGNYLQLPAYGGDISNPVEVVAWHLLQCSTFGTVEPSNLRSIRCGRGAVPSRLVICMSNPLDMY
jgi:hypothetical protein